MAEKLSTGQEPTLKNYLKLTEVFFSPDGKAADFIRKKIKAEGEEALVEAAEEQMVRLLFDIEYGEANGDEQKL